LPFGRLSRHPFKTEFETEVFCTFPDLIFNLE
jgi:hypothetical protein